MKNYTGFLKKMSEIQKKRDRGELPHLPGHEQKPPCSPETARMIVNNRSSMHLASFEASIVSPT